MHGNTKHGHIWSTPEGKQKSPTYTCWQNMHARCYNPNNTYYKNYGGRGIDISPEWHNFENFLDDMGLRPEGLTLERKDNDKGYSKENCRWATRGEQNANRRVKGVGYDSRNNCWRARITRNGKTTFLGNFPTEEAALTARQEYKEEHGL